MVLPGEIDFLSETIALVREEPITLPEFRIQMDIYRSPIVSLCIKKYTINEGSFSWTEKYGFKSPLDILKEKALNESLKVKIQLLLMKEKGILQDISYATFLRDLKNFNKKRKETFSRQQVGYGPLEFSEKMYLNYTLSNNVILLKKILQQKEIFVTDSNLQSYFVNYLNQYPTKITPDFEQIKRVLIDRYMDQKYEEFIEDELFKTPIILNKEVYDQISI
jgi:hypothetical protein